MPQSDQHRPHEAVMVAPTVQRVNMHRPHKAVMHAPRVTSIAHKAVMVVTLVQLSGWYQPVMQGGWVEQNLLEAKGGYGNSFSK